MSSAASAAFGSPSPYRHNSRCNNRKLCEAKSSSDRAGMGTPLIAGPQNRRSRWRSSFLLALLACAPSKHASIVQCAKNATPGLSFGAPLFAANRWTAFKRLPSLSRSDRLKESVAAPLDFRHIECRAMDGTAYPCIFFEQLEPNTRVPSKTRRVFCVGCH